LQHAKGLTLKSEVTGTYWLYFADQWDPKSPWHDQRVRLAASLAIDRNTIDQALTLGHSKITGSIIPESFGFYWQPPSPVYDPTKARQLLAEAGYPSGFEAGEYFCDFSYASLAEAVLNYLQAAGIRLKLRPLERAAFFKGYAEKSFKNLIQGQSGAFGNAATRLEAFVVTGGAFVYGTYPDIDALFQKQAEEGDTKKREDMLHRIQQLVNERAIYAPIWQQAFLSGVGPRLEQSGLGLIAGYFFSAPYEDITLVGK
jgi:peptide/nickel transport system substrate-binding protein